MRSSIAACLVVLMSLPAVADLPPPTTLETLDWLVGYWVGDSDDGTMEELWLPAAGDPCCCDMMIGIHRDVSKSGDIFFEYLRIERVEDGWAYVAKPSNQPEASFRLRESGNTRVVFENPDHDFPQRITYELKDDVLTATVSGTADGEERSSSWTMKRAELPKKEKE